MADRLISHSAGSSAAGRHKGLLGWRALALRWHGLWLAALGLGAGVLVASPAPLTRSALAGIGLAAVPALAGLLLGFSRNAAVQVLIILNWGAGAVLAVTLGGGITGPLAAWLFMPVAAAVVMGRAQRMAFAAAVSLAALGLAALADVALSPPPLPANLNYGLALLCLMTMALALGGGLVLLQRQLAREALDAEQGHGHLRQALDEQPNLLLAILPGGQVAAAWGPAPLGLGAQVLVGRPLTDLATPEDQPRLKAALDLAHREGRAEIGFKPAGRSGGMAWLDLRAAAAGRITGALRDASVQLYRETALETARADAEAQNAGKSRFLANMSHELRTPLNAIMGFSDIMRQRLFGELPGRYGEYAELIHESGSHLLELINDVLDMSKIEAERFELAREEFDARDAVTAVLRLMRGQADRAGVQLRGLISRQPLEVTADRRAVKQIVLNLISNALKFTPKPGSVTVTARADGAMLELIVADTGVGISPEDLARIGRPYEQAGGLEQRAAGTGLGLSLVRAFAELHGGTMTIESRLGEGATVSVRLPVMEDAAAPAPAPTEAAL